MKKSIDNNFLLKVLEEAVLKAGDFALNFTKKKEEFCFWEKNKTTGTDGYKKEKSLVSTIDFKVQKIITDYISDKVSDTSNLGLLAEEQDAELKKFNVNNIFTPGKYTILIDPIDGTANYCQRFLNNGKPSAKHNFWSVSVALLNGKETIGGIIYYPALKKLLLKTCKGHGLWLNKKRIFLDNYLENFKPNNPIRVSGTIKDSFRKNFKYIPEYGSFTVSFLGLLKGGIRNSKIYIPELNCIPKIKAYIGKNIDILDLGCCELAYIEAGGEIFDKELNSISMFDHLDRFHHQFIIRKSFVMTSSNKYASKLINFYT